MNVSPATCLQKFEFIKDLEYGINNENSDQTAIRKSRKIGRSLQLQVKFNNIKSSCLVDSGSQISAISEEFYEKLKKDDKKNNGNASFKHGSVSSYWKKKY